MSCGKGRNWHFRDPKFKNFLGEQSKNFSLVRATSKSYATPLICWTRNCDFFIYNLFVYVKNGSIAQKWGVIENVNKLHQATAKLRLVKILEILGQGASYRS